MSSPAGATDPAQQWVRKLTASALPVFPRTASDLRNALAGGNESMRSLARIAATDPAFAFHVLRESNALASNSDKVFYDLEHAMSVLGMQRVRALIDHLPALNRDGTDHAAYRSQLAISHHAGLLTQSWLEFRKRPMPHEARWLATLRTLPLWSIAFNDERALQSLQRAFAGPRRDFSALLQRMFGCSFEHLTGALFSHWKLAAFIQPLLAHEQQCSRRLLGALARLGDMPREQRAGTAFPHRVLLNENLTFAVVANGLSLQADIHWFTRGTLRMQRAAAGLLNLSVPAATQRIHAHAAMAARSIGGHAGGAPAAALLDSAPCLHRPVTPRKPAPARKANRPAAEIDAPGPAVPPVPPSKEKLKQALTALRDHSGAASGIPGILRALLTGLHQGVGLARVLVLARSREEKLLLRLQAGLNETARTALAGEDFLARKSLFTQVLSQKGFVRGAGERRAVLHQALPDALRAALRPHSFVLGALPLHGRPGILIYADAGSVTTDISEPQYNTFRKVCQEAGLALRRLEMGK